MFDFTLQLPDGRVTQVSVKGETWRWHAAFSEACQALETREGLSAGCGIRCLTYDWAAPSAA